MNSTSESFRETSVAHTLNIEGLPFAIFLTTAIVLLKFYSDGRIKPKNKSGLQPQRKIPLVSHFPVRLPSIVEGIYSLYRFRKDGLNFWQEMQTKYGDIFEIPVGNKIFTCVFDPGAAQKILLSSNPLHLSKRNFFYDIIFIGPTKDGLANSDYDLWSVHKKILSRCFTYKSLQTYLPIMNGHGKSLVNRLREYCSSDVENSVSGSNVHDSVWTESVKILAETLAGKEIFKDGGEEKLNKAVKEIMTAVQYRLGQPHLLINFIWNLHSVKRKLYEYLDHTIEFLQKILDGHKITSPLESEKVPDNEESDEIGVKAFRCMLEELLCNGVSDKEILDEAATFAITGHETVSNAVKMILFHLACNAECQQLCREEVDQLLETVGIEKEAKYNFTMDDLANLKYLERVILEGMRLTPAIPIFLRYLGAPLQIDEGLTLKGGSTLFFSPWCVQRNPEYFPNPTKFDPDRFLPENAKKRHNFSFQAFSTGTRNCIGYKFGLLEVKIILALILQNFQISTTDNPDEINYFTEVSLRPDIKINLILKDRQIPSKNC